MQERVRERQNWLTCKHVKYTDLFLVDVTTCKYLIVTIYANYNKIEVTIFSCFFDFMFGLV